MAYLSDFRPLFRLLDDYETHRSRPAPPSRVTPSQFTPAFDVRELNDAYYLDGELPGVDQSNIEIEFIDPQTLVIKGHTERSYQDNKNKNKTRWHQPTVQDDEDDSTETPAAAAAATSLTTSDRVQAQSDSFHYWASERSVGEFQRTFTFPTRVDQDGVRASLKNGILSVVVPKQSAPKMKKIRIQ